VFGVVHRVFQNYIEELIFTKLYNNVLTLFYFVDSIFPRLTLLVGLTLYLHPYIANKYLKFHNSCHHRDNTNHKKKKKVRQLIAMFIDPKKHYWVKDIT
jgi:hypothetical protein